MGNLKYNKAWDVKLKRYVTPSEVNEAERHDRNRYFSEQFNEYEDKGEVLTLHRKSKTFKNKNNIEITRQAHFSAIGKNTKEYREKTAKLIERQESLVHKLCKEIIKDIKYIKVPEIKANIMGEDYTILHEQLIKVEFKSAETKDKESGRIPDAIVVADIFGTKQEIYIEFLYSHEVDERKRKLFEYFNKNCLEVNMYHLRDNLEESEKSLKLKIKKLIENNCYWVTNSVKLFAEKDALNEYVLEFSKENILSDTLHKDRKKYTDTEWLKVRLFLFKDQIKGIDKTHPCYFIPEKNISYSESQKCTNIGDCAKCNNCVFISNYSSSNTSEVKIYCKRNGDKKRVNPINFTQKIINRAIELATINKSN